MKLFPLIAHALLITLPALAQWTYPPSKQVEAADTYFGTTYRDPYRWLEELKGADATAWFKAQATLTDDVLAKLPGREALVQEWMALDRLKPAAYRDISCRNGRVFYRKTLAGEDVGKLFFRKGWQGKEELLFDPSTYKPGVTSTLQTILPSFDGKFVALGISAAGAEVGDVRVLEVATAKLLPDLIEASYGPSSWAPDSRSFCYDFGSHGDPQSVSFHLDRSSKRHVLGTPPAQDLNVLSKEGFPGLGLTPEELPTTWVDPSAPGYVLGGAFTAQSEQRLFVASASSMKAGGPAWRVLCQRTDNLVETALHGDQVFAISHSGAPKFKVIQTSLEHPDWSRAKTVIPEGQDVIQSITTCKDYLLVVSSNGIVGRVTRYALKTGRLTEVRLPMTGSVGLTCPDPTSNRCLVAVSSWTAPTTLFELDAARQTVAKSTFNTAIPYPAFDGLVAEEVEVPGEDGTMIPLSIVHPRNLPLDGSSSCILEGYGCYGMSITPSFRTLHSVANRGVVLAFAHVRGGGEKGEAWHKAGFKATKPNTWKDFNACAGYLIRKGYTSAQRLGGMGTSAGGILISRAITARPDLFAAVVCNVGDANAMRSEFGTDGPANAKEYGSVQDPAECLALYEMDGVQHVRPGVRYPAVLGVGGWNDPRVAPWQPGKFIAALQNATTSSRPVLMKVNYDNGHFTEDKSVTFRNFAGQFAFLLWQTGHKNFQPAK